MPTRIIPTLRYTDAATAITWLCNAFGFEERMVVRGEAGCIAHAQLTLNGGMIMLASAVQGEFDQFQKPPSQTAGFNTQSAYIIVENADVHYERAVTAGAEIVMDIKDEGHGGRGYSCRDPEGHLWNFGTYDPWL